MVKVLDRESINRMTRNSGRGGSTYVGGGGGGYTLPLAADGTRGGVQTGYTTDAANRNYAVQLSNEKMYVNVPWVNVSFGTQATDYVPITIGTTTKNVLTAHQSLSDYATKYWVGQQGYATEYWVGQQGYATEYWVGQQGYATKYWVGNNYLPLSGGTITGNLTVNQTFTCQSVEIGHTNEVNATGSSNLYLQYRNSGHLVLCYNGQNVGIGTASPSYKLHVAGTIYATGAITERSDIRCKDVETYQWAPSLSMIANAPIIRYSMKDDDTHRMRVGSVAQYWQKMIPEAVSKSADGTLSIAQGDICMVGMIALAREVKQLKDEIKLLRNGRS